MLFMTEEFEIVDLSEIQVKRGAWDYKGLAELLKNTVGKVNTEKQGIVFRIDKIMEYHEGDLKNKSYYAKKALERAAELAGLEVTKIAVLRGGKIGIAVKKATKK